jgi:hypothetical protein
MELASTHDDQWTEDEEVNFLIAHTENGNKWSDIAKHLSTKTNNEIKNHFYTIFRKYMRKIIKKDFNLPSPLEAVKCHYVVILLIKYFNQLIPTDKKDYLLTLINAEQITVKQVYEYLKSLNEIFPLLTKYKYAKYLWDLSSLPIDFKEIITSQHRILPAPVSTTQEGMLTNEEKQSFFEAWMMKDLI